MSWLSFSHQRIIWFSLEKNVYWALLTAWYCFRCQRNRDRKDINLSVGELAGYWVDDVKIGLATALMYDEKYIYICVYIYIYMCVYIYIYIYSSVTKTRRLMLFCDTRKDPRKTKQYLGFEWLKGVFLVHDLND